MHNVASAHFHHVLADVLAKLGLYYRQNLSDVKFVSENIYHICLSLNYSGAKKQSYYGWYPYQGVLAVIGNTNLQSSKFEDYEEVW